MGASCTRLALVLEALFCVALHWEQIQSPCRIMVCVSRSQHRGPLRRTAARDTGRRLIVARHFARMVLRIGLCGTTSHPPGLRFFFRHAGGGLSLPRDRGRRGGGGSSTARLHRCELHRAKARRTLVPVRGQVGASCTRFASFSEIGGTSSRS